MAYKLSYQVVMSWVGPGAGPMTGLNAPSLPGGGASTQAKEFGTNPAVLPIVAGSTTFTPPGGSAISNALASGDITTLLSQMTSDLSTQMNAALPTLQAWVAGNP